MIFPSPVIRLTRKMSPLARDPKYANGSEPIAMPSGRNPVGSANSVGNTSGWVLALAGVATRAVRAARPAAIPAKVRLIIRIASRT